jgi:hypothetical protein
MGFDLAATLFPVRVFEGQRFLLLHQIHIIKIGWYEI